jgi:DNA polymerase III delta prime subunit
MIKIKDLTVKNFMSVGNQTQAVNFGREQLTLVLGENLDQGGDDSGSRNGTGKTTMAYLLPGWLDTAKTTDALQTVGVGKITDTQSPYYDFHSCAQGQNGVSLISTIQQRCSLVSLNTSNLHFIILDEVDNLTVAAHASLKAVMNYTHVVFILTTNNLDKVDKGIINRSILLDMNAAPTNAWVEKIAEIYLQSNLIAPPDNAIASIVNAGYGSARTIFTDIEIAEAKRNKSTGSKPN